MLNLNVAQARFELARSLRTSRFSYHYSFHYQIKSLIYRLVLLLYFDIQVDLHLIYLWSGLYLNHIEISGVGTCAYATKTRLPLVQTVFQLRFLLYSLYTLSIIPHSPKLGGCSMSDFNIGSVLTYTDCPLPSGF